MAPILQMGQVGRNFFSDENIFKVLQEFF